MHEHRPAPETQHDEPRSERAGEPLPGRDALALASQMGNVAFTALARSVARQPDDSEYIEFPPDHVGPGARRAREVPPTREAAPRAGPPPSCSPSTRRTCGPSPWSEHDRSR